MAIRFATPEDIPALVDIGCASHAESRFRRHACIPGKVGEIVMIQDAPTLLEEIEGKKELKPKEAESEPNLFSIVKKE